MKWPFVSRSERHDLIVAQIVGQATRQMAALLEAERARSADLLEKYHALRVAGANPREPDRIIPPPKQPPRPIMHAIRAISPRDDAAYFANLKLYRDNEIEADADPEQFAERIRRGRLTGDEPTPQQAD